MSQVIQMMTRNGTAAASERPEAANSLLVDSAISHAEKLQRVLQLEQWINGTTEDDPLHAGTCRKWQEERARLLAELNLEELSAANSGAVNGAEDGARGHTPWLRRVIQRLRQGGTSETSSS